MKTTQQPKKPKLVMSQFRLEEKDRDKLTFLADKWDVTRTTALRYIIRRTYSEIIGEGA